MKKARSVFYEYNGTRFFCFLPLRYILRMTLHCVISLVYYFLPESIIFGKSSTCLIKNFSDFDCPGCGMSRAVWCILHGEYAEALNYNRFSIVVFFLLMYQMLKWSYVPPEKNPCQVFARRELVKFAARQRIQQNHQ